ncbi:MAG: glycosyltransferase family 39 protein [Anaerolineales bacterium]|nr:glycosyltransferase family 39 protein [Anaerolineales bacterium]
MPPFATQLPPQINAVAFLVFASLGLMVANVVALQSLPPELPVRFGCTALAGLGGVGLALAVLMQRNITLHQRVERVLTPVCHWLGIQTTQFFALLFAPLYALTTACLTSNAWDNAYNPLVANVSWLVALGLAVFGGWRISKEEAAGRPRWSTVGWVAIVVVLAFVIRGTATEYIPVTMTGDEGSASINARLFLEGRTDNLFTIGWRGFPALYYFVQSFSVALFGSTVPAVRVPAALVGALTVGALYLLGRAMFGHRIGLAAAILLSASHLHVHFSRIALNNVWDGLSYVVALGALWHGWHYQRRASFLVAGLAMGLAMYFYPSARTLILLGVAWLGVVAVLDRVRLKANLPNALVMLLAALVTLLPLGLFFIRFPDEFFGPMRAVGLTGQMIQEMAAQAQIPPWQFVAQNIFRGLMAFTVLSAQNWYVPQIPMLQDVASIFFYVGLLGLALRWRDSRTWLLGLWMLVFGFIGGLSESTPAGQRYVAAAPVIGLVAAYGVAWLIQLVADVMPSLNRWALPSLMVVAVWLASKDLTFYFLEYTPNSHFVSRYNFEKLGDTVAEYLAEYLPRVTPDWKVYFFGAPYMGFYSIPSLQYLSPQYQGEDMNYPWGDTRLPAIDTSKMIFVFLDQSLESLKAAQAAYPGGLLLSARNNVGQDYLWLYQYPMPANAAELQALSPTIRAGQPFWPPSLWLELLINVALLLTAGWGIGYALRQPRARPTPATQPAIEPVAVAETRAIPIEPASPSLAVEVPCVNEPAQAVETLAPSTAEASPNPTVEVEPVIEAVVPASEPVISVPAVAETKAVAVNPNSTTVMMPTERLGEQIRVTVEMPFGSAVQITIRSLPNGQVLADVQPSSTETHE